MSVIENVLVNGVAITNNDVFLVRAGTTYSASRKLGTYARGGRDGVALGTPYFQGIIIDMEFVLAPHCTGSDLLAVRDYLARTFNLVTNKNDLQTKTLSFVCSDGSVRSCEAIFDGVTGGIDTSIMGSRKIQVIAKSEAYYLTGLAHTATISSTDLGGFAIPFDIPLDMANNPLSLPSSAFNAGTTSSYLTLTISGALTGGFVLYNITTDKAFTYTEDLAGGETLVVNMQNRTAFINGADSVIANIDLASDWLTLEPGYNQISLITATSENASIAWHDAYIGI